MENKSGTNTSAISLPKGGGGAIKGIGETFQPNLLTGTGNFSIPIATSPGRNGFGPQLTLQYSTGNGNGPFGLGWQLSIPRITRKTEKGLPEYKGTDVFVMSGAEDLVPVLDQQGNPINVPDQGAFRITRYRPRTEGLFARIEKWTHKDTNIVHWRATTKENVTSIYGKSPSARILHPDPSKADPIFEWLLEETFDAKGNHILYEYIQEDPALKLEGLHERNRRYTQTYICRILYGNTPDQLVEAKKAGPRRNTGTSDERHYVFEVLFDYRDLPDVLPTNYNWRQLDNPVIPHSWPVREDRFSSYRAGFEIRTLRRCERVLMLHHFKEGELTDAPLVKSTNFNYSQDPWAGISLLEGVTVWGYRKDSQNPGHYLARDMPPVTFKYSQFEPDKQRYRSVTADGDDLPPLALNDPNTTLMDIFGDGLPDIVQSTESGFHFWENQGDATIGRRHPLHGAQPPIMLGQPGVAVGDLGGDGLPDLIVDAPPVSGFYEATPDGGWKTFRPFTSRPTMNLADPNARLVDLTGNGLSDLLITRDTHFLWYRSKGEAGYEEPRMISRQHDLDAFPDVYFSDPRVRLADMTGDGLNDIVLLHDGRIDYWANLGWGSWSKRLSMANTPRIGYGFDPRRLFLVDLDGTGCSTDLVYVDFDQVHFWFSRSGNSWSEKHTIKGTPFTVDTTALQFADFFGTGTACLIWSYDFGSTAGSNYKVLDFCGGKKPHLLVEMSNNMGATTRAQYAASTKFYLDDKKNGSPWVTNLPFPVQVLEKTEVIDHISKTKLVTTYKYHHGYYEGREREFRGFGRVDQYDTEEFESFISSSLHGDAVAFDNNNKSFHVPPVLTKTWFHTGVYFDRNLPSATGFFYDEQDMMDAYRNEFYKGDNKAFELDNHIVDKSDTPHEAYRALRGSILRSEVYALDKTDKEIHPYTVTENRNEVRRLQKRFSNNHAVYLAKQKESISYHYERNPDDPRVTQQLTLEFDDWGNVIKSATIGYPRRPINAHYDEQREIKATYSWSQFINEDQQQNYYYVGINCEAKVFEVHGFNWLWPAGDARPVPVKEADLAGITNNPDQFLPYHPTTPTNLAGIEKRIVDWKRVYFRQDADPHLIDTVDNTAHRLPLCQIDSLGLPYETYQVVFTNAILQTIFGNRLAGINLGSEGGYVQEGNYNGEDYWWIPSGRQSFDKNKFYHPQKSQDPFGNITSTEIDDYALLVIRVTDALPAPQTNIIESRNDYRVLQPYEVIDPNGTHSQAAFDTLGLVVGSAIWGEDENGNPVGDSLAGFEADLEDVVRSQHIADPLNVDTSFDSNPHNILRQATTRLVYDLKRYMQTGEPNVVYTLARETHVSNEQGTPSRIQHRFFYSDGFGREYQSKIQAEPDNAAPNIPRWVGTGTKIYNNKGKPVEKYEPFFSDTHLPGIEQHGVSSVLFYDPLERVICTLHPNHAWEKVVFDPWKQNTWDVNDTIHTIFRYDRTTGTLPDEDFSPADDEDVGQFFRAIKREHYWPTWYKLRINNALRDARWPLTDEYGQPHSINTYRNPAEQRAARLAAQHAGTPTTAHLDTLGRPFLTVADNGRDDTGNDVYFKTCVKLDIEGNDLKITDPRQYEMNEGRAANAKIHNFIHGFDIAGRKLYVNSVDAGEKWLFLSVDNQPLYSWDANGNRIQLAFDKLRRPKKTLVQRSAPHNDEIVSHVSIYGEALATNAAPYTPSQHHLRGQIYAVVDSSGLSVNLNYDFKGNLTAAKKLLAKKYTDIPDWSTIDFTQTVTQIEQALLPLLEDEVFYSFSLYDALNRVIESIAPDHSKVTPADAVPTDGSVYNMVFNEANLLDSVAADISAERAAGVSPGQSYRSFVSNINYNARGQRDSIEYGNGVVTSYDYEPETYRLLNLTTRRQNNSLLQNLHYAYDPAGNITGIKDDAIKTIYHDQQAIEPVSQYQYDPSYRLITATGREHKAMGAGHYRHPNSFKQSEFVTVPPSTDAQALQMYTESFNYDPSGNLDELIHRRGTTTSGAVLWRRQQSYDTASNRIATSGAAASDNTRRDAQFSITHDTNGNITSLAHLANLSWDFNNRLLHVQLDASGGEAYYQYDMSGQRTRKIVLKGANTKEERIYLGGYEVYRKNINGNPDLERQTLHVMDDKRRMTLVETQTFSATGGPSSPRFRYQLINNIGSAVTEVDETQAANIISYEEYYAYGGTSFIGGKSQTEVSLKRYRYSNKERDDETGLYFYGARYYAPWMGRWCSPDPAGMVDGLNIYSLVKGRPTIAYDHDGRKGVPTTIDLQGGGYEVAERGADTLHGGMVTQGTGQRVFDFSDNPGVIESSSSLKEQTISDQQKEKISSETPNENIDEPVEKIETAGDIARVWEQNYKESSKALENWVSEDPSLAKTLAATAVQTAMDLGAGFVEVLKLGEGAAEGGWGWGKDALRLLAVVPVIGRLRSVKTAASGAFRGVITRLGQLSRSKHVVRLAKTIRGIIYEPRCWSTAQRLRDYGLKLGTGFNKLLTAKGYPWSPMTYEHLFISQRLMRSSQSLLLRGLGNSYLNTFLRISGRLNTNLYNSRALDLAFKFGVLAGYPGLGYFSYKFGESVRENYVEPALAEGAKR
ncbi:VCBS repeat-containing protein [candidate division WOR-3 bacterium]|nr:VCBS repeat-containing protein [candidate division WOR-3 bacterium]